MLNYCKAMMVSRKKTGILYSCFLLVLVFIYVLGINVSKYLYGVINADLSVKTPLSMGIMRGAYVVERFGSELIFILTIILVLNVLYLRRKQLYGSSSTFWKGIPISNVKKVTAMLIFDGIWAFTLNFLAIAIMIIFEKLFGLTNRWTMANILSNILGNGLIMIVAISASDLIQYLFRGIRSDFLAITLTLVVLYNIVVMFFMLINIAMGIKILLLVMTIPLITIINSKFILN